MVIFYIILSAAISMVASFFVFKKIFLKKYHKQISFYNSLIKEKGTGRYGIIRVKNSGTVEFREILNTKEWIKIDILNICPDDGHTETEVLHAISYKGWVKVETDSTRSYNDYYIEWFSDNSMRLRDEKIKEIVDDKGDN
jgi:hypothetical protein